MKDFWQGWIVALAVVLAGPLLVIGVAVLVDAGEADRAAEKAAEPSMCIDTGILVDDSLPPGSYSQVLSGHEVWFNEQGVSLCRGDNRPCFYAKGPSLWTRYWTPERGVVDEPVDGATLDNDNRHLPIQAMRMTSDVVCQLQPDGSIACTHVSR